MLCRQGRAHIFNPDFIRYIQREFLRLPDADVKLTTGMLAVFWALHACDRVCAVSTLACALVSVCCPPAPASTPRQMRATHALFEMVLGVYRGIGGVRKANETIERCVRQC